MEFTLSQQAKSRGGDKYICTTIPSFNIYFPQSMSRANNIPHKTLKVFVEGDENWIAIGLKMGILKEKNKRLKEKVKELTQKLSGKEEENEDEEEVEEVEVKIEK